MASRTMDMLNASEIKEAYQAWSEGWDVGRLAARYGVTPKDLSDRMKQIQRAQERRHAATHAGGTLGDLSARLFEQLDRLGEVDRTDTEALDAEIRRTQAVGQMAEEIIKNANTVLAATKLKADYTQEALNLPKLLEG